MQKPVEAAKISVPSLADIQKTQIPKIKRDTADDAKNSVLSLNSIVHGFRLTEVAQGSRAGTEDEEFALCQIIARASAPTWASWSPREPSFSRMSWTRL